MFIDRLWIYILRDIYDERREECMKKRVLHIIGSMNLGGAETMIMNIFRNIDRNAFSFDFFVDFDEKNYYEEEIISLGGKIFRSGGGKSQHFVKYINNLVSVLKCGEYDIVHVHASNASAFLPIVIAKIKKVPKRIVHSHNTATVSEIKQLLQRELLVRNATDLLSCGKDAAKWMFGKHAEKAIIVNLPVDCNRMVFNNETREMNRKQWGADGKIE